MRAIHGTWQKFPKVIFCIYCAIFAIDLALLAGWVTGCLRPSTGGWATGCSKLFQASTGGWETGCCQASKGGWATGCCITTALGPTRGM